MYLGIYLSTYLPVYRSIYLSIYLSYGSTDLPGYSTRLHFPKLATSKTQHFCETSSFCEVDHIKQKAILRDLLLFFSWPHQKRNNSARLPSFLNLTTSKTKQFCETSSFFTLDNIKTKQFCDTSFKNGKLSAALTASYQRVLRFFHSTWCQVTQSAAPVT